MAGSTRQAQRTTLSWSAVSQNTDFRADAEVFISIDYQRFIRVYENDGLYQIILDDLEQGDHHYRIEYRETDGTVIQQGGGQFTVSPEGEAQESTGLSPVAPEVATTDSLVAAPESTTAQTHFRYDSQGRVIESIDAEGYRTTYQYDAFGQRIASTRTVEQANSENGLTQDRTVSSLYSYDERGNLIAEVMNAGSSGSEASTSASAVLNQYDAFGRVITSQDSEGNITTRDYQDHGGRVVTTDALQRQVTQEFDAFDRVVRQVDALGAETTFQYDDANLSVSVTTPEGIQTTTTTNRHGEQVVITDGNGHTTEYDYDRDGRLTATRETLADGSVLEATNDYDQVGLLTATTDAQGRRTDYTYDASNRLLTRTVDADGLALATAYEYDGLGRAIRMTDANGVVTETAFNLRGEETQVTVDPSGLNLTTRLRLDGDGQVLRMEEGNASDQAHRVTAYQYDNQGRRLAEIIDPDGLALTTRFHYDRNGQLVARTDANGQNTRFVYDEAGQERYRLDAEGNVTERRYDAAGRLIESIQYALPINLRDLPLAVEETQLSALIVADSSRDRRELSVYDQDGRLVYQLNGLNEVTERRYDDNGNVVATIGYDQAIPGTTEHSHGAIAAALITLGYSAGNLQGARVAYQVYDNVDRVRFVIDSLGQVTERSYDAAGNVVQTTAYAEAIAYSEGLSETQVADLLTASTQNRSTRFVFDGANRQRFDIDALGYVREQRYDALGRVTTEIQYANAVSLSGLPDEAAVQAVLSTSADDRQVTYSYDSAGRLLSRSDAEGQSQSFIYDAVGNAVIQRDALNQDNHIVYDDANRQRFQVDAEGGVTEWRYDALGQISETIRYTNRITASPADTAFTLEELQALVQVDAERDTHTWVVYDAIGRVRFTLDSLGYVVENRYAGQIDVNGSVSTEQYGNRAMDRIAYDQVVDLSTTEKTLAGIQAALRDLGYDDTEWYTFSDGNTERSRVLMDQQGREQYVIDALGHVTEQVYNAFGELAETRVYSNPVELDTAVSSAALTAALAGNTVLNEIALSYDTLGRQTHQTQDPTGLALTTESVYNRFGDLAGIVDADGNTSLNVYDNLGWLRYTVDALGHVQENRFNANGEVIAQVRYNAPIDVSGLSSDSSPADIEALLTSSGNDQQSVAVVDGTGRPVYSINSQGAVVENRYDANSNLIEQIAYDQTLDLSTLTLDRTGVATALQALGYDGSDWQNSQRTRFHYDALNRMILTVDSEGSVTEMRYDARSNPVATVAYGTAVDYASLANDEAALRGALNASDPDNRESWSVYDSANRLRFNIDAVGTITASDYDAQGRLTQTTTYREIGYPQLGLGALNAEITVSDLETALNNFLNLSSHAPIAYYRLDEQSGTHMVDASGNGHHGRYASDVAFVTEAGLTESSQGAVQFHRGFSGRIDSAALQLNRLGLETWFELGELPPEDFLTTVIGNEQGGGWSLSVDHEGNLQFRVNANGALQTVQTQVNTGERYHVAASFDGQHLQLFLNGLMVDELDLQGSYDIDYPVEAYDIYLGANPDRTNNASHYQAVILDEVALYDQALSLADVQQHYGHIVHNQTVDYHYDDAGRLLQQVVDTDGLALTTSYEYDARGNQTAMTDANGHRSELVYDGANRLTWQRDALGRITTTEYNGRGQVTEQTLHGQADLSAELGSTPLADANDRIVAMAYDDAGRLIRQTQDPNGLAITTGWEYDAFGNQIIEIQALGSADEQRITTQYDRLNRAVSITSAEGHRTQIAYDAFGNRISMTDANGHAITQSDSRYYQNLRQSLGFVDGNGDGLLAAALSSAQQAQLQAAFTTRYAYDALNRLTHEVDANGIVTRYSYDALGNRTQVDQAYGLLAVDQAITEANIQVIGDTDQRSNHYDYDQAGRLVEETQADGTVTAYRYSRLGEVSERVVDQGASTENINASTRYVYDDAGRLTAEIDAEGNAIRYEYDGVGNLVRETRGLSASQTVDLRRSAGFAGQDNANVGSVMVAANSLSLEGNRWQSVHYPVTIESDTIIEFRFSADGLSELHGIGFTNSEAWDDAEWSTSTHFQLAGSQSTTHIQDFNTYDIGDGDVLIRIPVGEYFTGRFNSLIFTNDNDASENSGSSHFEDVRIYSLSENADARVIEYQYDDAYRQTGMVVDPSGLAISTSYEYDVAGNQTAMVDGNDHRTEMVYDGANRLIWQRDGEGYIRTQAYDERNNVVSETRYAAVGAALNLGQTPASAEQDRQAQFQYDGDNRLVERTDSLGQVDRFEHDAVGNVIRRTENATELSGTSAQITDFTYNAVNRVIEQQQNVSATGEVLSDGSSLITRFDYDAVYNLSRESVTNRWVDNLGNTPEVREETEITEYRYDLNNRVTEQIVDPDALALRTTYDYDAFGNRTVETDANNHSTHYYYDRMGRNTLTVDALGQVSEQRYDRVGNLVQTIEHQETVDTSTLTTHTAPLVATDGADRVMDYRYDNANRQIATEMSGETLSTLSYDGNSNITQQSDINGDTSYRYYDQRGIEVAVLDAEHYLTVYNRDAFGNLVSTIRYDQALTVDNTPTLAEIQSALSSLGYSSTNLQNARAAYQIFDPSGQVRFNIDRLGQVSEQVFDARGNVVEVIEYASAIAYSAGMSESQVMALLNTGDSENRSTRFVFDDGDRLRFQIDALGYVREQRYDSVGRVVTEVQYANGFNIAGQPDLAVMESAAAANTSSTDRQQDYDYDNTGRLIARRDGEQQLEAFGYDANGNQTRLTNALGQTSYLVYDADNQQRYQIDAEGGVTEYRYNSFGQVSETLRYANAINPTPAATDFTLSEVATALQADSERDTQLWTIYDDAGRERFTMDSLGYVVETRYASQVSDASAVDYGNDVVDRITYNSALDTSTTKTIAGIEAALVAAGYGTGGAQEGQYIQTRSFYDNLGRERYRMDGQGYVTEQVFNAFGEVIETRIYQEGINRTTEITLATLESALTTNTVLSEDTYTYDSLGRQTQMIQDPNGLAITTESDYNRFGEVIETRDGDNHSTLYSYDNLGWLRFTIDALGNVSENRYNANGEVTATIRYNTPISLVGLSAEPAPADIEARLSASASQDQVDYSVFDQVGRVIYNINSQGTVAQNRYDANGNVIEQMIYDQGIDLSTTSVDQAGVAGALSSLGYDGSDWQNSQRTRFHYDALNRVVLSVDSEGGVTAMDYDARGNQVSSMAYASAVDYDSLANNETALRAALNNSDPDNRASWTVYDNNNQARFSVDALGNLTENRYDAHGRVTSTLAYTEIDANALGLDSNPATVSVADVEQALSMATDTTHRATVYSYDNVGRLTRESIPGITYTAYNYDARGNVTSTEDGNGHRTEMVYDSANRLIWERDALGRITTLDYNGRGQVVEQTLHGQVHLGAELGSIPTADADDRIVAMAYDDAGRLISQTQDPNGLALTQGWEYDAFGNQITEIQALGSADEQRITTEYDQLNRKIAIINTQGYRSLMSYDVFGNRLSVMSVNGDAITQSDSTYYRHQRQRLGFVDGNGDGLLAANLSSEQQTQLQTQFTTRFAYDALNRLTHEVDTDGVVTHYEYDALSNRTRSIQAYGYVAADQAVTEANIQAISDTAQRVSQYDYDQQGRLIVSAKPTTL